MEPTAKKPDDRQRLAASLEQQTSRLRRAHGQRVTLLGQTRYLGTVGVLLVLPVVAGAYVGQWLDGRWPGSSVSWTMSLIFTGVVVGGVSAYLFIRE